MSADKMSSYERTQAIAKGEQADRLPCNPNIANGTARVLGCKISEFATDPKAFAKAQMACVDRFGTDSVRVFTDLFTWPEAMGAKIVQPEDDTADLIEPAIHDVKDIGKLRPADPYKDGRLPVHLEAMKWLKEYSDGIMGGVGAGVTGPFTLAFSLIGFDEMLRMCRKDPESVHKLCEVSLETCIAYADAAVEIGCGPAISEPMSSCTVVSPKVFREFSLPYMKRLIEHLHEKNVMPVVHICGQTNKIWEDIANLGIGGWSIDNVASIEECKSLVGDKCKIMGNVDPGAVVYAGTPLDVRIGTLESLKAGWDNPKGFMVMSGCSLPVETPFENIDAMMDTMREVGYPADPDKIDAMLEEARAQKAKQEA